MQRKKEVFTRLITLNSSIIRKQTCLDDARKMLGMIIGDDRGVSERYCYNLFRELPIGRLKGKAVEPQRPMASSSPAMTAHWTELDSMFSEYLSKLITNAMDCF